ncbi:hypothetical protein H6P81_016409 [Aristolochia fimbriata]|uniref:Uncharacterized protein n=1 Tax=Aristolochia fimbriata TaxID=158543 RepID=A0AAV7E8M5_ARIFI|nr:hypothetical protein H6P81_016409 [Aristolochia fimbriata]
MQKNPESAVEAPVVPRRKRAILYTMPPLLQGTSFRRSERSKLRLKKSTLGMWAGLVKSDFLPASDPSACEVIKDAHVFLDKLREQTLTLWYWNRGSVTFLRE